MVIPADLPERVDDRIRVWPPAHPLEARCYRLRRPHRDQDRHAVTLRHVLGHESGERVLPDKRVDERIQPALQIRLPSEAAHPVLEQPTNDVVRRLDGCLPTRQTEVLDTIYDRGQSFGREVVGAYNFELMLDLLQSRMDVEGFVQGTDRRGKREVAANRRGSRSRRAGYQDEFSSPPRGMLPAMAATARNGTREEHQRGTVMYIGPRS